MIEAFQCIRVMLFMSAEMAEIELLNQHENIEQELRKKHTELDNITIVQQWMDAMTQLSILDPTMNLDVFKYDAVLGDPRKATAKWFLGRLGTNPATIKNKLNAMNHKDINSKWMIANKVKCQHPHMESLQEMSLRVRFLKGFSPDALAFIRTDICSYCAEAGLSHKPFPLSRHVLLSADILTTAAFAHGKDKEGVPAYRDGEAGKELQMNMVKIVLKRLKEYSVRGRQDVFSNGPQ